MHDYTSVLAWLTARYTARRDQCWDRAHVCEFQGVLDIRLQTHTDTPHNVLVRLHQADMHSGLSSSDWDKLTYIILLHLERYPTCSLKTTANHQLMPNSSKPSPTLNSNHLLPPPKNTSPDQ